MHTRAHTVTKSAYVDVAMCVCVCVCVCVSHQDAPWSVRLSAKLLRERGRGAQSPWYPYIRVLPKSVPAPLETFSWEDMQQIEWAPMQASDTHTHTHAHTHKVTPRLFLSGLVCKRCRPAFVRHTQTHTHARAPQRQPKQSTGQGRSVYVCVCVCMCVCVCVYTGSYL